MQPKQESSVQSQQINDREPEYTEGYVNIQMSLRPTQDLVETKLGSGYTKGTLK